MSDGTLYSPDASLDAGLKSTADATPVWPVFGDVQSEQAGSTTLSARDDSPAREGGFVALLDASPVREGARVSSAVAPATLASPAAPGRIASGQLFEYVARRAAERAQATKERTDGTSKEAPSLPLSVRVAPERRDRFLELAQNGGGPRQLFTDMLDLWESKASDAAPLSRPFDAVRLEVSHAVRGLERTLLEGLKGLQMQTECGEQETAEAERALLKERELRALAEARESALAGRLRALQTEADAAAAALRSSVAAMKKELAEARETTQSLQMALKETRERADAAEAKAARAGSLQGKTEELALAVQKARFLQEETELKLARASDERDRARQAQSENEKLRMRQHETAEEERKALQNRAASERERLEATIERLQTRIAEMTREASK